MGGILSRTSLSIVTGTGRLDPEDEKEIIDDLNRDLEDLEKRYKGIRLMVFTFDSEDL